MKRKKADGYFTQSIRFPDDLADFIRGKINEQNPSFNYVVRKILREQMEKEVLGAGQ